MDNCISYDIVRKESVLTDSDFFRKLICQRIDYLYRGKSGTRVRILIGNDGELGHIDISISNAKWLAEAVQEMANG